MKEIERDVAAANAAFYQAFRDRNLVAMNELWSKSAKIACIHPGMGVAIGRDEVMATWRGILSHRDAPRLDCSRVEVHLLGTAAFVTCMEGNPGDPARLVATNVFVLEDGRWKLVHHQAGPLSPEAIRRGRPSSDPPPPDPSSLN